MLLLQPHCITIVLGISFLWEEKKRTRPKKEKRLGIVSSYVTWMSNNFGARGCRISNVEAGLYSLSSGDSSPSLGLEQQCDASAATVSTAARRTLLAYCSSLTPRPWPQCRQWRPIAKRDSFCLVLALSRFANSRDSGTQWPLYATTPIVHLTQSYLRGFCSD